MNYENCPTCGAKIDNEVHNNPYDQGNFIVEVVGGKAQCDECLDYP